MNSFSPLSCDARRSNSLCSLHISEMPPGLRLLVAAAQAAPPTPLVSGGVLRACSVDHIAIAFANREELVSCFNGVVNEGGTIIEAPHVWPVEIPGCPTVPVSDVKHLASVWAFGVRWALLAPCTKGDVIDRFLTHNGGPGLHHIAIEVPDIKRAMRLLLESSPEARQVSDLAEDEGMMSQVFFKIGDDIRIVELVERPGAFDGTFTCNNVAALTRGERERAFINK